MSFSSTDPSGPPHPGDPAILAAQAVALVRDGTWIHNELLAHLAIHRERARREGDPDGPDAAALRELMSGLFDWLAGGDGTPAEDPPFEDKDDAEWEEDGEDGEEPPVALSPPPPPPAHPRPVRPTGWTVERQCVFLNKLAECGLVTVAAREAGLSARSAHRLRARAGHSAFAAAWMHALTLAADGLVDLAFERALEGAESVTQRGDVEVRRRQPSDRMLCWLLTHLQPDRFGTQARARMADEPFDRQSADALPQLAAFLTDAADDPLMVAGGR